MRPPSPEPRSRSVHFVHCEDCSETRRVAPFLASEEGTTAASFRAAHRDCRVRTFVPTGEGTASTTWHDPLATRRLQVRSDDVAAVAVGRRSRVEEPLVWELELGTGEEPTSVELDGDLFWRVVERSLHPLHIARRALEGWAARIERFVRGAHPSDVVLLEDDVRTGSTTFARLTLTARTRLESTLTGLGLDAATAERLETLFEDELFPPLRIVRRVATQPAPRGAPTVITSP